MNRIVVGCAFLFLIVAIVCGWVITRRVNVESSHSIRIRYTYADVSIERDLDEKERDIVIDIFNHKIPYIEHLYCGFGDELSVCFDGKCTFWIAQDGCNVAYWTERDRYIKLREEEKTRLLEIMKQRDWTGTEKY